MSTADLPMVNATLNSVGTLLLIVGWFAIRGGNPRLHRACMLSAFGISALFLVSYLVYHAAHGSTPFQGQGAVRVVYFVILISHIVLAATVPVLAVITVVLALRENFDGHRRIARWTWPIWLYVSVTGVTVYVMLYRMTWT